MNHHLVVLHTKYLQPILQGSKTVECRLSQRRTIPFGLVEPGDMLWLKETSGPIRATAMVRSVQSIHPLDANTLNTLQARFSEPMQVDPLFFIQRRLANFATFITLADVQPLTPFGIYKQDRRAWVILSEPLVPNCRLRTHAG